MPTFTPLPGDIVGAPPYRATGCLTQGLFLKGDKGAQQRFCDLALNGPAGGALTFEAVMDLVLMTAIYADTMGSADPPDSQKGVMAERDVGFWTAVRGGAPGDEGAWKTYWLPSYLFVDSSAAMAAGREIFGYPKTTATFENRGQDRGDPTVTLVVQHFPEFGPDKRPVTGPLVTVTTGAPGAPAPGFLETLAAAWELFSDVAPIRLGFPLPPWPGLGMPQIMLRQARDATAFGQASLQEILVVTPEPTNIAGIGLLQAPTLVEIAPSASHPIMDTLGLAPSQVGELGFWIEQDFAVGPAMRLA
ncbi:MAG TPA: hypothetical protein VKQ54_11490 [Caulobacteraceae bacterium]|nr:hypothetical protein [Caulobacteraceae bacterium]